VFDIHVFMRKKELEKKNVGKPSYLSYDVNETLHISITLKSVIVFIFKHNHNSKKNVVGFIFL
jgi:hypothetical protein